MPYVHRIVDDELDELLKSLSALALEGPRGVGKTATAVRRAKTVFRLDEPAQLEILAAGPALLDAGEGTVVIDEWQRYPAVWDFVRRRVDDGAKPGRFLLTGSSTSVESPTHSGAGRIVQLRMRPMSLAERGLANPTVSLAGLLQGGRGAVRGTTGVDLPEYAHEILASGFPGIRRLQGRARRAQIEGYLARVVTRDFPDQGLRVRRPDELRAWLTAYAAATSTTTSYDRLLTAATPGEAGKPSKVTTIAYRDVLSSLWLLDPVAGWSTSLGQLRRLTQAPKHNLADPALAAHLLGIGSDALLRGEASGPEVLRDGTLFGALFESLVAQSVKVYAQANEAAVYHLRTRAGEHEVDLIVERADKRVVAFDVKLAQSPDPSDLRHLHWLREQLGERLLDAAVITTGTRAYRRDDGVAVIPAVLLGA
ncbi:MAG TPA: DUF4143 domain-containing protein [Candidatus Dormibacteraeota bacterium]|nr:DUF4143 domain-containing protein [Candidatus Dormibacteraeota bacterium]